MFILFLFKFAKQAFFFSRKTIKILRQVANVQSVILVPLVLVILLLPYIFDRSEAINEAGCLDTQRSIAAYQERDRP